MDGRIFKTALLLMCWVPSSHALTDDWILNKFDEITRREAVQDSLITTLQTKLELQDNTIRQLTEGQQHHFQQETKYCQRQTELENKMKGLQQQLLVTQQENGHQVAKLEERVSGLEGTVSDLQQKLIASEEDSLYRAGVVDQKQASLEGKVNKLQQQLLAYKRKTEQPQSHRLPYPSNSKPQAGRQRPNVSGTSGKADNDSGNVTNNTDAPERFNTFLNASDNTAGESYRQRRLLVDGMVEQDGVVAFHAVMDTARVDTVVNSAVNFESILLNFGNGYHDPHGLFITPTGGLYIISVALTSDTGNAKHHIEAALMKNDDIIGRVFASGEGIHREQGGITVVTRLQVDDEVWVKTLCCDGEEYYGERLSSFSGVLLYEMQ